MFKYKDININYLRYGNIEGKTIIFLHGWGQNIQMMKPLADNLQKYDLLLIDLPGHGKSEEPKEVWTLYDFADMVNALVKHLNIDNPTLVGHSFGGKISMIYAAKYQINKLVLLSSPYKKHIQKETLKMKILKKAKQIPGTEKLANFVKKHTGSTDYRNATPLMRKILVQHVNTDLTDLVKTIKCPTIIIWGTNDTTVPIEEGKELTKLIKDSALIPYQGLDHFAYYENIRTTTNIINSFMEGEQ